MGTVSREKRLMQSGRSLGGAQPKLLVTINGEEWMAKFPSGSNVDQPLIEHASMILAAEIGINTDDHSKNHAFIRDDRVVAAINGRACQ